jgi:sulfite reductase beta subunit-like hemoprotein
MANGSTKYTGVRENNRLIRYIVKLMKFFLSFSETVTEPEILAILKPMIKRYALERTDGERFGDFVIRAGYISPTTSGKAWYDGMGGEGQYRET